MAAAHLQRRGDIAHERHEGLETNAVVDLLAPPGRFERPGVAEDRQVARHDGKIDGAAGVEFAHGTWLAARREAQEQREAIGVSQGAKEFRVQQGGQGWAAGGLPWAGGGGGL